MQLETERLLIRPYQSQDVAELMPILSDPLTMHAWPKPFTPEETAAWLQRTLESYQVHGYGRYAVQLKSNQQCIGDAGLLHSTVDGEAVIDLGYIIHHPFWRHGYATEAASAIRDDAFHTLHLPRLHANMASTHTASRRVAEKLGMQLVREFNNPRNRNLPTLLYILENPTCGNNA